MLGSQLDFDVCPRVFKERQHLLFVLLLGRNWAEADEDVVKYHVILGLLANAVDHAFQRREKFLLFVGAHWRMERKCSVHVIRTLVDWQVLVIVFLARIDVNGELAATVSVAVAAVAVWAEVGINLFYGFAWRLSLQLDWLEPRVHPTLEVYDS